MDKPILAKVRSQAKVFVRGPFGAGKTSLALERVRWLLAQGVRGDDILVVAPHPVNATPFEEEFGSARAPAGASVRIATVTQLARAAVELHWPEWAPEYGFRSPHGEPVFLNVEGAQYYLGSLVDAALERGEFDGILMTRQQIVLQTLTTLSHAALHGHSWEEVRARLLASRAEPEPALAASIDAEVALARDFRALCLEEGLVDFSLLMVMLRGRLVAPAGLPAALRAPRHLIADNVEEDNAVSHALVRAWLPGCESALLCADDDGGFRSLLGADPQGAASLAASCDDVLHLKDSRVMSAGVSRLDAALARASDQASHAQPTATEPASTPHALRVLLTKRGGTFRFVPAMLAAVAEQIADLVQREGVPPDSIALVAPAISDALRFGLEHALARHGLRTSTHRPSRALADEPAARALLTFARLAHPAWAEPPAAVEVQQALMYAIEDLDPLRASALAAAAYAPGSSSGPLRDLAALPMATRKRIPEPVAHRYQLLRDWLAAYAAHDPEPLDHFVRRLFEEVLAAGGFRFRDDEDAIRAANQMVESAQSMRQSLRVGPAGPSGGLEVGAEYVALVRSGALGALYVPAWKLPEDAILITPPDAFMLRNVAVDVQFWLDASSPAWAVRVQQSLTHTGVLASAWPAGAAWSDAHELAAREASLRRTVLGLIRRTRRRIYVALSDYGESGDDQRGPLLPLLNHLLGDTG